MKMRSVIAPLLLLLAQQGPFRFDIAPKNQSGLPATQPVQMQAIYGSFRGLGQPGGNKDVTSTTSWSGSDSTVATVDAGGLVTPTAQGGSVTITGTSGRFTNSSNLVFDPFTCSGENYDVNDMIADGCEVTDPITGNHDQLHATSLGTTTCDDTVSHNTFSGSIPSDSRVHNPAISAFNNATGAAPDWYTIFDTGGATCVNDYALTFTTSGGGAAPCYKATIITDKITNSVIVSGLGIASISGGSGSYSDSTPIYFKIEKICSLPVQENVSYSITYHL